MDQMGSNNTGPNWYQKPSYADAIIHELPIAIQDMFFYSDGDETRQFYPGECIISQHLAVQ
jgi:hypothetical protein